jgi:hypothetical protein
LYVIGIHGLEKLIDFADRGELLQYERAFEIRFVRWSTSLERALRVAGLGCHNCVATDHIQRARHIQQDIRDQPKRTTPGVRPVRSLATRAAGPIDLIVLVGSAVRSRRDFSSAASAPSDKAMGTPEKKSPPMKFADIAHCAHDALNALGVFPGTWALTVIVFLGVVESIALVPYVGFLLKVSVGAILNAQTLLMFGSAARGKQPRLRTLAYGFRRPPSAQAVLMISGLVPFLSGVLYLIVRANAATASVFFGHVSAPAHVEHGLLLQSKYAMYVATLPFTFLAPVVVIERAAGWRALTQSFRLAACHWRLLGTLLVLSCAFDASVAGLTSHMPRPLAITLALALTVSFIAYSFALTFAASVWIYGVDAVSCAGQQRDDSING